MSGKAHDFDLAGLRLTAGEGRRLRLDVRITPLVLAGERYCAEPALVPVVGAALAAAAGQPDARVEAATAASARTVFAALAAP